MAKMEFDQLVDAMRRFNRFYTKQIGVLHEGLLGSQFSLTEVRVLYELAHREIPTAAALAKELDLDPGYLSRILRRFETRRLVGKCASTIDARQSLLSLTPRGRKVFAPLNARSHREVAAMLGALSATEQRHLLSAMATIERLLGARPAPQVPYLLRPHQPGDMGWIIHRHGALYAQEYGWDERFEALVAEIAAHFIQHLDSKCERCWIAERDGNIVGSVFLVKKSKTVAQLRLLLVEPAARGLGIGARLIDECTRFARAASYQRIRLWTNSLLLAARTIYTKAGYRMLASEPHHSFGHALVGEVWEKQLEADAR